jgi:ABC-2 type transport system permease protein
MRIRVFGFITWAVVRYTLSDRIAAFFFFLLPFAIMGLVGIVLSAGASHPLGIVSYDNGPFAERLTAELVQDKAIKVERYATLGQLKTAVREQLVAAGLEIPANFGAALGGHGVTAPTFLVEREELVPPELRLTVYRDLIAVTATGLSARYDTRFGHLASVAALRRAETAASAGAPRLRINQVTRPTAASLTGVAYSGPGNLVLFIFLNVAGTGAGLVAIRQFGVTRRMLSTGTGPWTIALSEGAGRVALGLLQALVIVAVGAVAFHVHWGTFLGVFAVVFLGSAISAAVALIMSALSTTPQQAFVGGPAIMLTAGMLGGCMWPLVFVPTSMQIVGRLFPLSWAMDAMLRLGVPGNGIGSISTDLMVLLGFAIATTLVAVPMYRRRIAEL